MHDDESDPAATQDSTVEMDPDSGRGDDVAMSITAGGGLGLGVTASHDGTIRIGVGSAGHDWLGPGRLLLPNGGISGQPEGAGGQDPHLGAWDGIGFTLDASNVGATIKVFEELPVVVLRLEANRPMHGIANGTFANPSCAWQFRPDQRAEGGVPDGTRVFGHQYSEFGIPTDADTSFTGFFFLPHRPPVVEPLWIVVPGGPTLMLCPLDAFHDQIVRVPTGEADAEDGVRVGWHGDLDRVPAGFATEMALVAADGPREALTWLGRHLLERHRTQRPGRSADILGSHLSYWTDNGASYWYRSEPDKTVTETLAATVEGLHDKVVPFRAFQLDSWFYPHEIVRRFDDEDTVVPPTGLITWDARDDILPDGIPALREALGAPPLVTHTRHVAAGSPYVSDGDWWIDGGQAHPATGTDNPSRHYERLIEQAKAWGVEVFEHDWLVEVFLGVRGLHEEPGRAREWQERLDAAAGRAGLTLQWCMASPADFLQSVTLDNVTSIRTSGDYRYLIDGGPLWAWFLHSNALARAVGLWPFKDVFVSNREPAPGDDEPGATLRGGQPDNDIHAAAEALLSAMSAGPVGIGDRVGRSEREIIDRTCRRDGVIVRPDVPMAVLDRCYLAHSFTRPSALAGECYSDHPAGRWSYVFTANVCASKDRLEGSVAFHELGESSPSGDVIVYDWESRSMRRAPATGDDADLPFDFESHQWSLHVLAPVLPGEIAVIGDPAVYATAGDSRIAAIRSIGPGMISFDALGAPGEVVTVIGWAATEPVSASSFTSGGENRPSLTWGPADVEDRADSEDQNLTTVGTASIGLPDGERGSDAEGGRWSVTVTIPDSGWIGLRIATA